MMKQDHVVCVVSIIWPWTMALGIPECNRERTGERTVTFYLLLF